MKSTSSGINLNENISPLISVAMPVYNGEKYLAEAIDSILSQTFSDFELIIIDDGSSDSSLVILKDYEQRDTRIRLISRKNRNLVSTLNEIIDLARGKWFARMDQDDIALPHRFERQLQWLEETGADICGSWVQFFGAGDRRIWKTYQTDEAIKMDMLFKCPLMHPTVIMKTELVKKLRYDKACEKAEDYDLWVRAAISGWKMSNVPEVLLLYRQHAAQISTKMSNRQQELTKDIQKKYWLFMSEVMELEQVEIGDVLCVGIMSSKNVNMDNVDSILGDLLRRSHGETRIALIENIPRIYFKAAADCSDIVSRLARLNQLGANFSFVMKVKLSLIRLFRLRYGGSLFKRLVRAYNFMRSSLKRKVTTDAHR